MSSLDKYQPIQPEKAPRLVVILGPTAVGKTELSLQLAERLDGEIISADSRLFYRGMDIGTAKPSKQELARVPHHLIDISDPDQVWSLAKFKKAAHAAILNIQDRGRLPFLVGGTGQYIHALVEGWLIPQVSPDPGLRSALERWAEQVGRRGLHQRLSSLDPEAAKKIDYRNLRRTVRALEVIFTTGHLFSAQRQRGPSPYDVLKLGLERPREELYACIDHRIDAMLASGLVEEVQDLLDQGYSPRLPTLSAIGYQEIIRYLQGSIPLEEAVRQIRRSTRVYVRRQANWFKSDDPGIYWFGVENGIVDQMEAFILSWLNND